jgi:hypothetical protein
VLHLWWLQLFNLHRRYVFFKCAMRWISPRATVPNLHPSNVPPNSAANSSAIARRANTTAGDREYS